MVSLRGISVHAVTQIDAKRLPEYETAHCDNSDSHVVACYIPILPGAQFWFEYSIDGPHPTKSMWYFKFFMNDSHVTSWDCAAEHGYCGKLAYSLQVTKSGFYGQRLVTQSSFRFSAGGTASPGPKEDCAEIRVYRVMKRRRLRDPPLSQPPLKQLQENGPGYSVFRIVDGGYLEFDRPARYYQYLLLDPHEKPYATFQFYCRSKNYLTDHRIIENTSTLSPISLSISSSQNSDVDVSPQTQAQWEENQILLQIRSNSLCKGEVVGNNGPTSITKLPSPGYPSEVHPFGSPTNPHIGDSPEDPLSSASCSPDGFSSGSTSLTKRSSPTPPTPTDLSAQDDASPASSSSSPPKPARLVPLKQDHARSGTLPTVARPLPLNNRAAYGRPRSTDPSIADSGPSENQGLSRPLGPFTRAGFLRRLMNAKNSSSF